MGKNASAVDIDLIADGDIITENCYILQASPPAHSAVPANNGALDPGMILDLGSREEHAALETDAVTNNNIGADSDVRSYPAVLADLGRGVDQHVAAVNEGCRGWCELLGALLCEVGEVQAGARQEVLGLTNVHPEALEVERVQLAVLDHVWEGLLLNGCRLELDAVEHGGVQDVDSGIDAVADELNRLLYEAVDTGCVVGLMDDDTILGRLLNLGHNNCALVAVRLVEGSELLEGVIASDVRVKYEKGSVVL